MRIHNLTPWWLLLLLSLVCVVASTTATAALQNGTRGIDLFEVHLPVNWKNAVADGVEFVFVKATEGIAYRNLRFEPQTKRAVSAGVLHGAIHFASAAQSSGAEQADFFIEHGGNWTADGQTPTLPGVLEMEGNIAGKLCHGMTATEITDWMLDFSNRYKEQTGRRPLLFLSAGWWEKCAGNNDTFGAGHPLWLANWAEEMGDLPVGWTKARFWQYSGLSGNGGEGNVFFGGRAELMRFARGVQ
ncbi:glycoside hydrolase superfamily [Aspergillus cavernicola]|uniref:Glycoside hydrolase superfamily n=1 Tax=Aspergillus cavernicola TaxID=176166 RepID=A0ABR4INZ8_9EURO